MDDESVLTSDKIPKIVKYDRTKDSNSERTKPDKNDRTNLADKIRDLPLASPANKIEEKSDDSEGQGLKFLIPSNIIIIWTRLVVLLGLKLSRHTDTLTEASSLIDELFKRDDIQNGEQYRNALDKFYTK